MGTCLVLLRAAVLDAMVCYAMLHPVMLCTLPHVLPNVIMCCLVYCPSVVPAAVLVAHPEQVQQLPEVPRCHEHLCNPLTLHGGHMDQDLHTQHAHSRRPRPTHTQGLQGTG